MCLIHQQLHKKIAPGVKIGPAGSFGPKTKPDQPYSTHGWDEKMRIQDKVNSSRPKPGQGVRLPSTQQGRPGAVFGGLPGMGLGGGGLGDQVK